VQGALKAIGTRGLEVMIDHDWYLIESIFYSVRYQPNYPSELSEKEIAKLERMRATMLKTVLPILGMVRFVASKFPPEAVEAKVTPDWLLGKGKKRFPQLVRVVKKKGEKARKWLEKQSREIVLYATGRLVWDDQKKQLVEVTKVEVRG